MHDFPAFSPSCVTMSSQVLRTLQTSARTIFSIRWCVVSVGRIGDCAGDGEGEGDERLDGVDCSEARRDMVSASAVERSMWPRSIVRKSKVNRGKGP